MDHYQLKLSRKQFILGLGLLWLPLAVIARNHKKENKFFRHGIASGDPLFDRVMIWTRVTTTILAPVYWEVALDKNFNHIVAKGSYSLTANNDYTVKIDVKGLTAATNYYYRFKYENEYSGTGKTRTLPSTLAHSTFNLAVVSCNNWEDGYFNSFRFLAAKQEVDLVLHLGDYIYEYGIGEYANPKTDRKNVPAHEIITLNDYRERYAHYRSDVDLQQLHANKAFCLIWDDHEIANDAYKDGAKNHQANEGDWQKRKQAAMQAYFEWLPVRATNALEMRRKITIGNDVELFLLEQRMQGRTQQMDSSAKDFKNSDRSILGTEQFEWLANGLKTSKATWKLIGNQVMFAGYATADGFKLPKYNDWWLGYPHERNKLVEFLKNEKINNPIFLTGDHHESFVLALHQEKEFMKYTTPFEEKPLAWELLTPSITSKNADRLTSEEIAKTEKMLYDKKVNPHLVFADIKNHGYFIASISKTSFDTTYFFVDNINDSTANEVKSASFSIDPKTFMIKKQ